MQLPPIFDMVEMFATACFPVVVLQLFIGAWEAQILLLLCMLNDATTSLHSQATSMPGGKLVWRWLAWATLVL